MVVWNVLARKSICTSTTIWLCTLGLTLSYSSQDLGSIMYRKMGSDLWVLETLNYLPVSWWLMLYFSPLCELCLFLARVTLLFFTHASTLIVDCHRVFSHKNIVNVYCFSQVWIALDRGAVFEIPSTWSWAGSAMEDDIRVSNVGRVKRVLLCYIRMHLVEVLDRSVEMRKLLSVEEIEKPRVKKKSELCWQ